MKLKLDANKRKSTKVEIEFDDKNIELKYYEKNTKQIDALKELAGQEGVKIADVEKLSKEQFFENLKGDKGDIDSIVDFYQEHGNLYDFINALDEELGKLKKRG